MSVDIPQQDLNLAIADIEMDVKNSNRGLPLEFVIKIDHKNLITNLLFLITFFCDQN